MKVKRLAECSPWSILQYFWPELSDNWSSFLSGHLRQVLLYNQQSIYIYACKCLICLGPSFQKMNNIFCSMGSFGPPTLKKIWSPAYMYEPGLMKTVLHQNFMILAWLWCWEGSHKPDLIRTKKGRPSCREGHLIMFMQNVYFKQL